MHLGAKTILNSHRDKIESITIIKLMSFTLNYYGIYVCIKTCLKIVHMGDFLWC